MSVGHGGHCSKHTGLEKLFILEYLEAKFQDAVDYYNKDKAKDKQATCQIFDPYNTGVDFLILINTKGCQDFSQTYNIYEQIHQEYQNSIPNNTANVDDFKTNWDTYLKDIDPKKGFNDMWKRTIGMDRLHASDSSTTLLYSPEQVAKFYALDLKSKGWRVSRAKARS